MSVQQTVTRPPKDAAATTSEPWRRRFVPSRLRRERLAGQVVRFAMVGGLNTVVDFALFNLLAFGFDLSVVIAYPISVAAGIANSFLWNKHWTFSAGGSERWHREAPVFLAVSVGGLLVNYLGFLVLHFLIGVDSQVVVNAEKLAASVVSMIWNFVGYRFLAFPVRRGRGGG